MSNQITVIDSSVLINAAVGPDAARRMRALAVVANQSRQFAATRFLQLEVLPIPSRYRKRRELSLYERFFNNVAIWLDEEPLIQTWPANTAWAEWMRCIWLPPSI